MADEIDISNDRIEAENQRSIQAMREHAAKIPTGNPGECDLCGEYSLRLVNGVCARCRDKHNLP